MKKFSTTNNPSAAHWQKLLNADSQRPHIHIVDMPFRQTSIWQDHDCEIGIWKNDADILAWGVFQPPWWNFDYAIHPSERGSNLEKDVFAWGKEQMVAYAKRSGENFYGSVEFFEDTPDAAKTIENLNSLGFEKFDWGTVRLEIELDREFPRPQLPAGFSVRPLKGVSEVDTYVSLHRAAFGSDKMTGKWRMRTLMHPDYCPELDLVIENPDGQLVGFCICWIRGETSQIEPLGVHPNFQGLGLGKALELSAFQVLWDHGARLVHVDHVSLNKNAIALSLKTGFRQKNNALRYYVDIHPT